MTTKLTNQTALGVTNFMCNKNAVTFDSKASFPIFSFSWLVGQQPVLTAPRTDPDPSFTMRKYATCMSVK